MTMTKLRFLTKHRKCIPAGRLLLTWLISTYLIFGQQTATAVDVIRPPAHDLHYTDVGFFDIHVCNWPDQPLFFLAIFSTYKYKDIKKIEVFGPSGESLVVFNTQRYRTIKKKNKPEKRVFMKHAAIPKSKKHDWYQAHITMANGKKYLAKDYVIIDSLGRPDHLSPAQGAAIPLPKTLSWQAVPGAQFYKITIWDLWDDGNVIYDSKLLNDTKLTLPQSLIKPEGWYSWRVHARDVNEHILLGDFNHGSLSDKVEFSTLR